VISEEAAGALWALDGLATECVHLWTPRSLKSDLVVVRGVVDVNDRRMIGSTTVTSPARTLVDLAVVQWRVMPVTWDDITDTPDDVVTRIITTLAA
jgi:hypothetical protein